MIRREKEVSNPKGSDQTPSKSAISLILILPSSTGIEREENRRESE